jgi:hypothetical protein
MRLPHRVILWQCVTRETPLICQSFCIYQLMHNFDSIKMHDRMWGKKRSKKINKNLLLCVTTLPAVTGTEHTSTTQRFKSKLLSSSVFWHIVFCVLILSDNGKSSSKYQWWFSQLRICIAAEIVSLKKPFIKKTTAAIQNSSRSQSAHWSIATAPSHTSCTVCTSSADSSAVLS